MAILFIILFLAILAVSIVIPVDLLGGYNGSAGKMKWAGTASQREHGLFNFKKINV